MRLLVTGLRGFIGRHVVGPALAAGFEVHGLGAGDGAFPPGVMGHRANLLVKGEAEAVIAEVRPTHLLHLAWVTAHGRFWNAPENLDWLAAGTRLMRAFGEAGGHRFVSAGTCAEYAFGPEPLREDVSPEVPATFYGRLKLAHHQVLMASAERFGFTATTGRVFFLYGPGEPAGKLVASLARSLAAGAPAPVGSGRPLRDFLHVEDVGRALVALCRAEVSGAVNVCSGEAVAIADLARLMGRLSARPELVQLGARPDPAGEAPVIVGDAGRLRGLGFAARVGLEEGLAGMLRAATWPSP